MNMFYARVVDVNDPEKSGRAKIRVLGTQDDETKIPDKDLFWARPAFPITNPALNGTAGQSTGLRKGTTIIGFWADADEQIPVMWATLASAGKIKPDGTLDQSAPIGVPLVVREIDKNEVLGQNIITKAVTDAKSLKLTTIGALKFTPGDKLISTLTRIDPSNLSGSIPNLLKALVPIKSSSSIVSGLRGAIQSAVPSDLMKMVESVSHAVTSVEGIVQHAESEAISIGVNLEKTILGAPQQIASQALSSVTSAVNQSIPHVNIGSNLQDTVTDVLKNTLGGAVGPLIGSIKQISSPADMIKVAGSFNFMRNSTMPALETGWQIIKNQAKKINV